MGAIAELLTRTLERALLAIPWPEILGEAWGYTKKVFSGNAIEGIYEVEKLSVELELLNRKGTRAQFRKEKRVKYLQNGIATMQDYGWGDGEILLDYRTSIGKPVDKYRLGYKTFVLLLLDSERYRGEKDDFRISWNIRDGFLKHECFWETDISQKTKKLEMKIIFPKSRHPKSAFIRMQNQRKQKVLPKADFKVLKDGRVTISWILQKPRLYENYILKWTW